MNLLHVVTQRILKGYVKVIILLTLNRSRRIIKCVVIGVLFTCVLLGLSSAPIFAASEDPLSSEVSSDFKLVVPDEYKDPVYDKLASGTRAAYDVNDVYLLLNNYFKGSLYNSSEDINSVFPLVRISYYLRQFYNDFVDGMGPQGYGFFEQASDSYMVIQNQLPLIYSTLSQVHGDGQNNSYYLSTIHSDLSNISSDLSILESSWTPFNITYNGWSSTLNGTYDTSTNPANGYNKTVYFKFTNSSGANTYRFSRLLLNMINTGISDSSRVTVYAPVGNSMYEFPSDTSYLMGRYVYLTDLPNNFATNQSFILKIDFDYVSFTTTKNMTAEYIPDSVYSLLSNAELDLRLINRQFSSIDSNLSTLTKYLADPDKVSAEQASQQVIDDTLDGFTGNGSAAAKTSDTGSMKNMSGSIQSGLSTGASAGNAASVFSNQTFWSWFTQQNSDQINNPYPAPVVNMNNRKSSGDEIVDFMSGHDQELSDLLGGSEW